MSWNQPLCGICWELEFPNRLPHRLVDRQVVNCCNCGGETVSGIWVRRDPKTVAFPWSE